jgi:hypothetical protein
MSMVSGPNKQEILILISLKVIEFLKNAIKILLVQVLTIWANFGYCLGKPACFLAESRCQLTTEWPKECRGISCGWLAQRFSFWLFSKGKMEWCADGSTAHSHLTMWHLLRTGQKIGQTPRASDRMDMCAIQVFNQSIHIITKLFFRQGGEISWINS